jgi:thiamine biosynthesis lipoprotein
MASLANKLAALLFFFAVSLRGQVGPAAEAVPVRLDFSGPGMGTTFRIALYTTPEKKTLAATAVESAFQRLASLNATFSDYEPNSEINRLAATAPTPWTASPDLLALTTLSLKFASDTHGAFDPTIGQLSRLWRSTRQRQKLAPPDRLQKALSSIGWQHLQIRNNTLTLTQPGLLLDFGGVAKGYAADQMLATLKKNGFPIALVQAGGDTAAGDAPPSQSGWPITLLTEPNDPSPAIVTLANRSVSTSGDLHQFIELDGIRYSHIIDPKTGLGLTRRIACSVIAPDTTTSDALATAFCILGPEKGRSTAKKLGATVRWTWQDEAGANHEAWFSP